MVERHLAKVNVASSNLVFRSKDKRRLASFIIWRHSQVVRQRPAKPLSPVQIRVAPPEKSTHLSTKTMCAFFQLNPPMAEEIPLAWDEIASQ